MFFENTLCSKCLGCNRLELERKYFQGVYNCEHVVLMKPEKIEHKQTMTMKSRTTHDAINKIHEILANEKKKIITEGEQLKIS